MELFPIESWYQDVGKVIQDDIVYVGFQVGATTRNRMWFEENWSKLANLILAYKENINIVLTGSPAESGLTYSLEKSINNKRILNLAGKFDICGAAALIDALSVLITPDTGPLHIAAALKTPTITISVTGTESSSKPRDKTVNHQYIQKPIICEPCLDKHCEYQKCMWQITPEEVFEALKKVI
jgi:ADP-heptose:LPS heptosyltransferase